MKIILTSVGTRGDMEPFIAIGELLKEKGHKVICAFPEQFRVLAENSNLEFASLGMKLIELLDSEAGKNAMGGASGYKKFVGTMKLAMNQNDANKELVSRQQEIIEREQADRVLYNGKAVYPIIWGLRNKGKTVFISPLPYMHYVEGHTHVAFNNNFGEFFNKLTFSLTDFGMIATIKQCKKWLKISEKHSRAEFRDILHNNKSLYTISPSLFPRPDHWNKNLRVAGYHECKTSNEWQADEALKNFLKKHEKIILVTFGSMVNMNPEGKTSIFLEILERNNIPAIINTASGGLTKPENFDSDLVHFVSGIPYEWIFPRIYGVIHHGGSGTTHLGLKYGCVTMIVPHIIDQFVWNNIVHEKGAGPKGIKIGKINSKNLEPKILELYNNIDFKTKVEQIKDQMAKEDLREELYQSIIE